MNKITPEHLSLAAIIYVRQSTQDQLLRNHESRHRQYALAEPSDYPQFGGDRSLGDAARDVTAQLP